MSARHRESPVEITSITSAPVSRDEDINARQRRYLFAMSIRMLCFVGAIVVEGWVRWALVLGAVFLPYVAVVLANAAAPRREGGRVEEPRFDRPRLPEAPR